MVRKEDLHWSEDDTRAVQQYRKEFESGNIPYTILTGSLKDIIQK